MKPRSTREVQMVLWNHIVANHLQLVGMEYGNIRGGNSRSLSREELSSFRLQVIRADYIIIRTQGTASHVIISTLPGKLVDPVVLESERQHLFSSMSWSHNFLCV
jgi:hypothetical protein